MLNSQDLIGKDCLILSGRHTLKGGKILGMRGGKLVVNVSNNVEEKKTVTCEQSEVVTIAQLTKRAVMYMLPCGCWRSCVILSIYGNFCKLAVNRGDIIETRINNTTMVTVGEAIRDNTIIGKNCLFYVDNIVRGGDIINLHPEIKKAIILMQVDDTHSKQLTIPIDSLVLSEKLTKVSCFQEPFITNNARIILAQYSSVTLYDRDKKISFNTLFITTNIPRLVYDILRKIRGNSRGYKSNGK